MRRRTRKFIGAVAMLALVIVYALLAMALAQSPRIQTAVEPWRTLIYAALGLGWALPMIPLIAWMERRDDA